MTTYELWEGYVVDFQEPRVEKYNNQCLSLFISALATDKKIYISTGPMQL
jgi:hypothetical protein